MFEKCIFFVIEMLNSRCFFKMDMTTMLTLYYTLIRMLLLHVDVQEADYKKKGCESWDIVWNMLWSPDWKLVTGENLETGIISWMHYGKSGKVFMVEVNGTVLYS